MHQEGDYPRHMLGTQFRNSDCAAYAAAFGGYGETVLPKADFAPDFDRALALGKPTILNCKLDPRVKSKARDFTTAVGIAA